MSYELPGRAERVESEYRPRGLDRGELLADRGYRKADLFVAPSIVGLGVAAVRCDRGELQPI